MPTKREILERLHRNDLIALVERHGLAVLDRRVREQLVAALDGAAHLDAAALLADRSRDQLKDLCRALGLDDGGRDKAAIVARLTGAFASAAHATTGAPGQATSAGAQLGLPLAVSAPRAAASTTASTTKEPRPVKTPEEPPESAPAAAASPPPATTGKALREFKTFSELSSFVFGIADLLRGAYKPSEYGKVFLPMTILRRFDCVARRDRPRVRKAWEAQSARYTRPEVVEDRVLETLGLKFFSRSAFDFESLRDENIEKNFLAFLDGWSANVRDLVEQFRFRVEVERLAKAGLLYQVVADFAAIDLSPDVIDNHTMGQAFEDLIRRFAEQANETAGEHYTPREVIELMVDLLLAPDGDRIHADGFAPRVFDPACGTGGMLSVAEERIEKRNARVEARLYGQELNPESYAICKGDIMIRDQDAENIVLGNSFTQDGHAGREFDYMLSNPPFGVEWRNIEAAVRKERDADPQGRFRAGLPRVSDGSFLFLQHMASKMKPAEDGGSRLAIVFNGSPLFAGDAGSGESEIRGWLLKGDLLEAIVALPDQLFFNTGISTYVWVVTNRKAPARRGKVLLINAVESFQKMKRSLGNKRNEIGAAQREEIVGLYRAFADGPRSKVFDHEDFGYRRITVERPLRSSFHATPERIERLREETAFQNLARGRKGASEAEKAAGVALQGRIVAALGTLDAATVWKNRAAFGAALDGALAAVDGKLPRPLRAAIVAALSERDETADVCVGDDGKPEPDPELRDFENVPLKEDVEAYFAREVRPHVPDAWIDHEKTRVGWEIPFTRHFYEYKPLRPLAEIESEIKALEGEIQGLLREVMG